MSGRTIIITGASDGIGAQAARQLVASGEHVVLVGRSPEKTRAVAAELGAPYHLADFTRLDDVRALASALGAYARIDVLMNNAGGVMGPRETTTDGFEKTLQVNHLAPFLLTNLLIDRLTASRSVVLNTSSAANQVFSRLDLTDLELTRGYTPNRAYGNAKLANILFTRELHRRYHPQGLSTAAFHPGTVATNFASESSSLMRLIYRTPLRHLLLITPQQGTDTMLWLANGTPGVDWQPGQYYDRRNIGMVHPIADNPVLTQMLWDQSAQMVGL
ncbi:SDR family NAD(P)-dependent oxidoreductase [Deinococcus deserti]|uniref:Putative short-chain dehydrogenase/reductase SDR n=1 Tax=Deinococcus deserti (strain DSM 17065 / CIP 109153 / LMG 22923 / VCD115) TaxID=546414 RepID=C1CYJ5_DEIDV|nr:SDR family NAD(P)-dependent oxidoreductase [Deinococcus deserti]ACO45016.1 putative short-chain dehydrogenase/reductase SDR [Deinococcus deserti VCD115]